MIDSFNSFGSGGGMCCVLRTVVAACAMHGNANTNRHVHACMSVCVTVGMHDICHQQTKA